MIPQKKETGKKLLVIDDSDQIRWFLKHVFNKEYQILEARNGQDGINVALKEEPDLILCDVMMPVKDGYETCREIKNDPKMAQTPVVMLTAKVESEDVITGIEAVLTIHHETFRRGNPAEQDQQPDEEARRYETLLL